MGKTGFGQDWAAGKGSIKKGQAWLEKDENVVDTTGFKTSCYLYTHIQNWDLIPTSIQANQTEVQTK